MVMSSIAKGRITSLDTSDAERAKGVLLVMSHLNVPKLPQLEKQNSSGSTGRPTGRVLQVFQDNFIHYANQPIALVVAETLEEATEGARLVQVRYAAEPPQVDLGSRMGQTYQPKKAGGGGDPSVSSRGDMQAGLNQADQRLQQVYWTPHEVHNPMEQHATVAVWDGPDHLTLYDATQGVFSCRERVAGLFGIPQENVRVISPFLGGGFGSKGPVWSHVMLASLAAKKLNRPVKVEVKRPQMFGMLGFRTQTRQAVSVGAKSDGTLTALRHDTIAHTSNFDEFVEAAGLPARMLYPAPNSSTSHRLVRSDIGTPSFMRAPGEAQGTFGLEMALPAEDGPGCVPFEELRGR